MAGIKPMAKVRANQRGYFGGMLREAGEAFTVPDGFKASWVDPVGKAVAEPEADVTEPAADAEPPARGKGKGKGKPETVQAPEATPFAEPVRVANEANDITGQTEPDWVRPI